jgi:hypothetical protein
MKNAEQNIFERLINGEIIGPNDPYRSKMREATYATMTLMKQMNSSSNPEEIRNILSEITETKIDESTAVFPPFFWIWAVLPLKIMCCWLRV